MRCSQPIQNTDGSASTPSSPMICCFAFAAELYLKSLLHGGNVRGHDLSKLFERLNSGDRRGIATQYEALTERKLPQLRQDIESMAEAFVNWRYIYEKSSAKIPVHRLATLARSIYRHVHSARPHWNVQTFTHARIDLALTSEVASTIIWAAVSWFEHGSKRTCRIAIKLPSELLSSGDTILSRAPRPPSQSSPHANEPQQAHALPPSASASRPSTRTLFRTGSPSQPTGPDAR